MRRWVCVVLWLIGLAGHGVADAAVRAWLDREEIALGETVTLNIEVEGAGATAPDFSALDAEFERRGSSSSSQISLSQGQRSATTLFAVSLQPRREGTITVPALQVGGERTPALSVRVGPSPIDTGDGGDVFLEAALSPGEVYVQQQVIYALKLYYAVSLWDGQLDAPTADGVQSYRLGDDLKYQVERAGRRYSVIERRFALVPERSGEIELGPARFDGTGLDRGGYGGLLGSAGIRLTAVGKPLRLTVRTRPDGAADPWLPALDVSLQATGEVLPAQIKVGEPLSLGLQLRARGLVPAQLPEISLPAIDGAAIYPDQASTRDTSNAEGLSGERFRRFAIVPQRAGTLRLPPVRIPWWDVASDQQRWAELPAREIEVLPGAADEPTPSNGVAESSRSVPLADAPENERPSATSPSAGWSGSALVIALLAGVGLGWAVARVGARHSAPAPANVLPPPPAPGPALRQALDGGEFSAIAAALRTGCPDGRFPGRYLDDPNQRAAWLRLETHLYAATPSVDESALRHQLREAFARGAVWRPAKGIDRTLDEPYPPLYG